MFRKIYTAAFALLIGLLLAGFTNPAEAAQPKPLHGRPGLHGQITTIDDNTLIIEGVHGSQTIQVSDETAYHAIGQSDFGLADLQVGDVILATGQRQEDDSLLASHVALQPEGEMVAGRILSVSEDSLVLNGRDGQEITVQVDPETWVARRGQEALAWGGDPAGSELAEEGMLVMAFGTLDEESLTAHTLILRRLLPIGAIRPVFGQIEAINGDEISLTNRFGLALTVLVDDETRFLIPGNPNAGLDDLAVGDTITAAGPFDPENQTMTARRVVRRDG